MVNIKDLFRKKVYLSWSEYKQHMLFTDNILFISKTTNETINNLLSKE